jgi:sigma-E factor negative regulatory protein RseA
MKERISALLDGELEDAEAYRQIATIRKEAELRDAWDTYHLIGDAMRGHLAPDVGARVAGRLAHEPAIVAPVRPVPTLNKVSKWSISAAASLAAIALVAWVAQPILTAEPKMAQSMPATPPLAASGAAPSVAASPAGEAARASGVANYLLAHQRYSANSVLQGVVPYVRTVTHDQEGQR